MRHYFFAVFLFLATLASAQNWQKVKGIDSVDVYSIINTDNYIYAITRDKVFYGISIADSFHLTPVQPETEAIFTVLYANKERIYLGTLGAGVFYSDDHGMTWNTLNSGLTGNAKRITALTCLGDSLYCGSDYAGVFAINLLKNDKWMPINNGLVHHDIRALHSSGDNLVAVAGLYLFIRPRTQDQWYDVYFDSIQTQRQIFETLHTDQYLFAGSESGIYRSSDNGTVWEPAHILGFPRYDNVIFDAEGQHLYAGLDFGNQHWIFSSKDWGINWEMRAHEFTYLWDLKTTKWRLWAGRMDGLWYLETGITNINDNVLRRPNNYNLLQNYPNPFNPATTISYNLLEGGHVEIEIYDINGKKIYTLIDEMKQPGNHKTVFDASNIAAGVYFYRLTVNNQFISKKMICLK